MEKLLKAAGQKAPQAKRTLELNMGHPLMGKIKALFESDRDNAALKDYCVFLFDLAVIAEGGKLEDPARFSRQVGEMMTQTIPA
jgi:molecular chaperone HtpG